jgi:hypothetical protein
MKLIYYSTAYFASHGGSSHSRHFFAEAQANPSVKQILLVVVGSPPTHLETG